MAQLDPSRTTALGILRYAIEYQAAAIATEAALPGKGWREKYPPAPVRYLLDHSIELALKAFLLHQGATLEHLKDKLGHDLERCLVDAEANGLAGHLKITAEDRERVCVLNDQYARNELGYIVTEAKTRTDFPPLMLFAVKMLFAITDALSGGRRMRNSTAGRILKIYRAQGMQHVTG